MTAQCPACSTENPGTATFCSKCGARLAASTGATPRAFLNNRPDTLPEEQPTAPPTNPPRESINPPVPQKTTQDRPSPIGVAWKPIIAQTHQPSPLRSETHPDPPPNPLLFTAQMWLSSGMLWRVPLMIVLGVVAFGAAYILLSIVQAAISGHLGDPEPSIVVVIGLVGVLATWGAIRMALGFFVGEVVGEARAVRERQETSEYTKTTCIIWTFRVERYDGAGNRMTPVPVELRGNSIRGAISEGDRVEVRGRWRRGETMRVRQVRNLTTDTMVKVKGDLENSMIGIPVLLLAWPLLFLVSIIGFILVAGIIGVVIMAFNR